MYIVYTRYHAESNAAVNTPFISFMEHISGLWCLTPVSTIFQLYRGIFHAANFVHETLQIYNCLHTTQ
jgi:hypothetical protein